MLGAPKATPVMPVSNAVRTSERVRFMCRFFGSV